MSKFARSRPSIRTQRIIEIDCNNSFIHYYTWIEIAWRTEVQSVHEKIYSLGHDFVRSKMKYTFVLSCPCLAIVVCGLLCCHYLYLEFVASFLLFILFAGKFLWVANFNWEYAKHIGKNVISMVIYYTNSFTNNIGMIKYHFQ